MNRSLITKAQVVYHLFWCKLKCEFSFIDFHKFLVNVSADDWHHYNNSTFSILVTVCLFERQLTRKKEY